MYMLRAVNRFAVLFHVKFVLSSTKKLSSTNGTEPSENAVGTSSSVCDISDAEEILTGKHLANKELLTKAQVAANNEAPFVPKIFKPKRHVEGE